MRIITGLFYPNIYVSIYVCSVQSINRFICSFTSVSDYIGPIYVHGMSTCLEYMSTYQYNHFLMTSFQTGKFSALIRSPL